jgi:hypothetical protein
METTHFSSLGTIAAREAKMETGYAVSLEVQLHGSPEELDQISDQIMDEMLARESASITTADLSGNLSTGTFELGYYCLVATQEQALADAEIAILEALGVVGVEFQASSPKILDFQN